LLSGLSADAEVLEFPKRDEKYFSWIGVDLETRAGPVMDPAFVSKSSQRKQARENKSGRKKNSERRRK
jgi:hypothetical protein